MLLLGGPAITKAAEPEACTHDVLLVLLGLLLLLLLAITPPAPSPAAGSCRPRMRMLVLLLAAGAGASSAQPCPPPPVAAGWTAVPYTPGVGPHGHSYDAHDCECYDNQHYMRAQVQGLLCAWRCFISTLFY